MFNKASLMVLISLALTGCEQLPTLSDSAEDNQPDLHVSAQQVILKWLDYADPVADANLAIGKSQLRLIALDNNESDVPGIDVAGKALEDLIKACDVEVVLGRDAQDYTNPSGLLQIYTSQYNKTVISACRRQMMR